MLDGVALSAWNTHVMMCEPINVSRPYCELYHVYLDEIQYYIGPYQIVNEQSLGMPYKQVLKRLKKNRRKITYNVLLKKRPHLYHLLQQALMWSILYILK